MALRGEGIASRPTRDPTRARNDVLNGNNKKKAMKIIAFGLGLG